MPATEHTDGALSVTEVTRRIKNLIEEAFAEVWVRGEVSNLRIQSSGHAYFTLKDSGAQLSAVMFRNDLTRSGAELRDGSQIAAFGKVGVYEARGSYQLVIRAIVDDGLGRLKREFEALKARLAAEGLFSAEKKRPLPYPPRVVGFVTSPTGAALQDFISVLKRRHWKGRLIVIPAKVQGVGAANEIAEGIRRAGYIHDLDTLVVGRGGGSIEDLWAFNEEPVARAIAASEIPVISAVGHEIDFTLADFAADRRAETPTAAAELISSLRMDAVDRLARAEEDLSHLVESAMQDLAQGLDMMETRLYAQSPLARIRHAESRLATLDGKLGSATRTAIERQHRRVDRMAASLATHTPDAKVALAKNRVDSLARALELSQARCRAESLRNLNTLEARLRAAGLDAALSRGFAVVKNAKGRPIAAAGAIVTGETLTLRFADGEARAIAANTENSPTLSTEFRRPLKKNKKDDATPSLFDL